MHDFQYTFRQAHQDRLEDAGIVQYRPIDVVRGRNRATQHTPIRQLRLVFATIISIFTK